MQLKMAAFSVRDHHIIIASPYTHVFYSTVYLNLLPEVEGGQGVAAGAVFWQPQCTLFFVNMEEQAALHVAA